MEEKLLELLADICAEEIVKDSLDVDLFQTGLLDSLAYAELLYGIEENFGIIIAPSEIKREEIDTPRKILELVRGRMEE